MQSYTMLELSEERLSVQASLGEVSQNGRVSPSPRVSKTPEPQNKNLDTSSIKELIGSIESTTEEISISPVKEDFRDKESEKTQELIASSETEDNKRSDPSSATSLLPSDEHTNLEAGVSEDSEKADALSPRETSPHLKEPSHLSSPRPSPVQETSQENPQQMDGTPATRSLRKRKRDPPSEEELMRPLTEEERQNWAGWAEIESEPALFNHILKGHGVKDVKIKELMMGIDDEFLTTLPHPVYGLIFLFKYRDGDDETADLPRCPPNIWFANQIASNSCATVAMLNILMNVPGIDLGTTLSSFKAATRLKKPPYRGRDLKNNAAIRVVHNSFVRRVEVLNADLYLQNDFEKWQKQMKAQASAKNRKNPPSKKKTAKQKKLEDEEPAFHFIAYVPVNGEVWRMDGIQRNPINLGTYQNDSWLTLARENIYTQMALYPADQSYNFMAVCRSPLSIIHKALASNARSLHDIESKLTGINPDWRAFLSSPPSPSSPNSQSNTNGNSHKSPSPPRELSESYGLTPAMILSAAPSPAVAQKLERAGTDMEALMMLRAKLIIEEKRLQREHCEEVMDDSDEAEKVQLHMVDYGPDMYKLVKEMLDSGALREIWDEL